MANCVLILNGTHCEAIRASRKSSPRSHRKRRIINVTGASRSPDLSERTESRLRNYREACCKRPVKHRNFSGLEIRGTRPPGTASHMLAPKKGRHVLELPP